MTITVYGIPNCDSVKKARKLLDQRGVAYTFHDFKNPAFPDAELRRWVVRRLGDPAQPQRHYLARAGRRVEAIGA